MSAGLLNPDARVVTVPPLILTFFTVPLLFSSVQYTFVESIAMPAGLFSPDARVVTVPPLILTFFTVPLLLFSVQYIFVESTATRIGKFNSDVRVTGVGESVSVEVVVCPDVMVMPVSSPLYMTFPLESFPCITALLLVPAEIPVIVPEWAEHDHAPEANRVPLELYIEASTVEPPETVQSIAASLTPV